MFLRSEWYYNGKVGQEALLQCAFLHPGRQPHLSMLTASSCLPLPRLLNLLRKCKYLRVPLPFIGKQNSLQSSKKQVLLLCVTGPPVENIEDYVKVWNQHAMKTV